MIIKPLDTVIYSVLKSAKNSQFSVSRSNLRSLQEKHDISTVIVSYCTNSTLLLFRRIVYRPLLLHLTGLPLIMTQRACIPLHYPHLSRAKNSFSIWQKTDITHITRLFFLNVPCTNWWRLVTYECKKDNILLEMADCETFLITEINIAQTAL